MQNFKVIFEVLTGWSECALGAPLLQKHHIGLEVNCRLLQMNKPFLLELTPNLLFDRIL